MLHRRQTLAALALVALVSMFVGTAGVRAAGGAPAAAGSPDFCSARAAVVPWDASANDAADTTTSDHFFVNLWTSATKTAEARVVLLSDTDSYSIELPSVNVKAFPDFPNVHFTAPVEIVFDHPVTLHYNYVAAARSDGGDKTNCPPYIEGVLSYSTHSKAPPPQPDEDRPPLQSTIPQLLTPHGTPLHATLVSHISAKCGSIYTGAHLVKRGGVVGDYGNVDRFALVRVFVAGSGRVVGTRMEVSSGSDRLDAAAAAAAHKATFEPASFLCAPAVSTYDLRFDYEVNADHSPA